MTLMLIKYQFLKKNHIVQKSHLNTSLDIMIIRALCIKLPQMIGYVKCCDSNKRMSFKVINKKLF